MSDYDVVVIGGGAAGLSAAAAMHGFLSRDGLPPGDLLALGRAEVTAQLRPLTAVMAARMVPRATSRRAVRTQRGRSTGTPAFAGIGIGRWAERSS